MIDDKDEKIIYCAMRYALGRRAYIAIEVIDYIKKVLPALSMDTLMMMQQDIENKHSFGDELYELRWMTLYGDILNEIKKKHAGR